jgi:hypothetical protein
VSGIACPAASSGAELPKAKQCVIVLDKALNSNVYEFFAVRCVAGKNESIAETCLMALISVSIGQRRLLESRILYSTAILQGCLCTRTLQDTWRVRQCSTG